MDKYFCYKITGDLSFECREEIDKVEISKLQQEGWYISDVPINWTLRRYNKDTGKDEDRPQPNPVVIELTPEPTVEELAEKVKQQNLQILNGLYSSEQSKLALEYTKSMMVDQTEKAKVVADIFTTLEGKYVEYQSEINAGNDPFAVYGTSYIVLDPLQGLV